MTAFIATSRRHTLLSAAVLFLVLSAKTTQVSAVACPSSDLIINEVLIDCSGSDDDCEYVKFFNRGPTAIDLAGLTLLATRVGQTPPTNSTFTFATNTLVQPFDCAVAASPGATAKIGIALDISMGSPWLASIVFGQGTSDNTLILLAGSTVCWSIPYSTLPKVTAKSAILTNNQADFTNPANWASFSGSTFGTGTNSGTPFCHIASQIRSAATSYFYPSVTSAASVLAASVKSAASASAASVTSAASVSAASVTSAASISAISAYQAVTSASVVSVASATSASAASVAAVESASSASVVELFSASSASVHQALINADSSASVLQQSVLSVEAVEASVASVSSASAASASAVSAESASSVAVEQSIESAASVAEVESIASVSSASVVEQSSVSAVAASASSVSVVEQSSLSAVAASSAAAAAAAANQDDSDSNSAAIIGGVVGGLAGLCLILILVIVLLVRRGRKGKPQPNPEGVITNQLFENPIANHASYQSEANSSYDVLSAPAGGKEYNPAFLEGSPIYDDLNAPPQTFTNPAHEASIPSNAYDDVGHKQPNTTYAEPNAIIYQTLVHSGNSGN